MREHAGRIVPSRSGVQRNRLPVIARWKILDDFRRSLLSPVMVALLVAGWTVLPGHPLVWTAAALASLALPILIRVLEALTGPHQRQSWSGFVRAAVDDLKTGAARSGLQLAFMANQAYERLHAIGVTLVRLGVTRHQLLEWETMAAHAARGGSPQLRAFLSGMIASPLLSIGAFMVVAAGRPRALPVALPVLTLWTIAPLIAFALSRPVPRQRAELTSADRAYLHAVAVKTWRHFETFVGAEDHGLPPDNVQLAAGGAPHVADQYRSRVAVDTLGSRSRADSGGSAHSWQASTTPCVILLIGAPIALIVRIIIEIAHGALGKARRAGRCFAVEFFNALQRFAFERGGGPRNRDLPDTLDLWNAPVKSRNQFVQFANGPSAAARRTGRVRRHRRHRWPG